MGFATHALGSKSGIALTYLASLPPATKFCDELKPAVQDWTIFPALKTRCRDTIRLSFILDTKVSFHKRPDTARFTGVGAGCLQSTRQRDARSKSSGAR